jgi:hypothetical protein
VSAPPPKTLRERVDAAVLHSDRDFDLIAEHVDVRIDG